MKMKPVALDMLDQMRHDYLGNEKARVVRNALTRNDLAQISRVFESESSNPNLFSINLKTMPVTDQKRSGRCWIFSAMNVLREKIAAKYQIKKFELSQNYIAFYDKLEKTNYLMEAIILEKDKPLDDETNRYLLATGVHDGGQWDMVVSLVKKYGICPKTAMPETYQSSHTAAMNKVLNARLKKFAADVHASNDIDLVSLKEACLKECFGLIASCFGVPPKSFTFEYEDKDGAYHAEYDVTPLQFYEKYLGVDLDDYIVIINGPTADKPFHELYTVKYLGNVVGGNPITFLNLDIHEFKDLVLRQLKDGELVWFGCDAGKDSDRQTGLWDDKQFAYGETFDMALCMTKAQMLDTGLSAMNHAMVFTGVNLVHDAPTRWKIENSWGEETANKGYFVCSDTWFDKYVYEAVVEKKYLDEKQRKALEKTPHELKPWDPFGSLA